MPLTNSRQEMIVPTLTSPYRLFGVSDTVVLTDCSDWMHDRYDDDPNGMSFSWERNNMVLMVRQSAKAIQELNPPETILTSEEQVPNAIGKQVE